jgi:hypothetical protein
VASEPIWKREGFATRNQYRNAKARERGFSSYRQERDANAKAAGKPRDYGRERQRRDETAQSRGFASANAERGVKGNLSKWGIDFTELQRMRSANQAHWEMIQRGGLPDKFPVYLHRYIEPTTGTYADLAGYIVSYYHAIVDDKHNWNSVLDDSGVWQGVDVHGTFKPKSDIWWYRHFVQYSNKMPEDYYDTRYGRMV